MVNTTANSSVVTSDVRVAHFQICFAIFLVIFVVGCLSNAQAAEWKFVPTIGLTETHTDNVRLVIDGKNEGANITQISPGFTISANGQRLKLQANYVLQSSYYSGVTSETKNNHLLRANANIAFVERLFFIDGNANITQQNLTPFGQVTDNNLNLSNNKVEVKTYNVAPYFRHNFDNKVTGELRYSYDSVVSSATTQSKSSPNSTSDNVLFNLVSGSAFKTTNWGVNYNVQHIHFDRQAPLETEMLALNFGYSVTPLFKATATAGHEKNTYVSIGEKPPGNFGTVGFAWTPSQRTNLVFNAGQRFFGKTFGLTFNQRARVSMWSLGYNEDVTTTRGQFLLPATSDTSAFLNQLWQTTIPDAATRQQRVDNFIRDSGLPAALAQPINTFTNQVFLQRSLQGSIGVTGVQNTIVFNLFNNIREPLSTGGLDAVLNPSLLRKIKQTGVNGLWNVQLSPRTNASVSAGYSKAETLETTLADNTRTLRASISRQLQQKIKASVELRRLQRVSTIAAGNYKENAITLYLYLGF